VDVGKILREIGSMKKPFPRGVSILKDRTNWVLRLGKKFTGGKERRTYFQTKAEAEKSAAEFLKGISTEKEESKRLGLTEIQIAEAKLAFSRLGSISLLTAVDSYLSKRIVGGVTLADACARTIEIKKSLGCGEGHLKDLKDHFAHIVREAGVVALEDFDKTAVQKVIKSPDGFGKSPSPYRQDRRLVFIKILVTTALEEEWIKVDPTRGVRTPPVVPSKLETLSPKEIATLLFYCQQRKKEILAPFVLKIFSGVRSTELFKITWGEVMEDCLNIQAGHSKTKRRRSITIHPTLASWLSTIDRGKDDELVFSARPHRKDRKVAWIVEQRELADVAGITLSQNALRHVFGSYHYALFKDENKTAYEMGNSPAIAKRNYIGAINQKDSAIFWGLTPLRAEVVSGGFPISEDAVAGTL
jgi:integrase